jgi:hypothetical protein
MQDSKELKQEQIDAALAYLERKEPVAIKPPMDTWDYATVGIIAFVVAAIIIVWWRLA